MGDVRVYTHHKHGQPTRPTPSEIEYTLLIQERQSCFKEQSARISIFWHWKSWYNIMYTYLFYRSAGGLLVRNLNTWVTVHRKAFPKWSPRKSTRSTSRLSWGIPVWSRQFNQLPNDCCGTCCDSRDRAEMVSRMTGGRMGRACKVATFDQGFRFLVRDPRNTKARRKKTSGFGYAKRWVWVSNHLLVSVGLFVDQFLVVFGIHIPKSQLEDPLDLQLGLGLWQDRHAPTRRLITPSHLVNHMGRKRTAPGELTLEVNSLLKEKDLSLDIKNEETDPGSATGYFCAGDFSWRFWSLLLVKPIVPKE